MKGGENMKELTVAFKVDEAMKERLSIEAEKMGMTVSTLMRVLVIKYFEKGELK